MGNLQLRSLRKELDAGELAEVLLDLAAEQQRKGRRPRRMKRVLGAMKSLHRQNSETV